jgi:uncharacterized OB-fold protein
MTGIPSRAIDPVLFDWPSESPQLLGSRCAECQRFEFPQRSSCPACGSPEVAREALPTIGTLWTWTVQRFLPKAPYLSDETLETFRPYGVGYVELPGAVRVETRLTECDLSQLRIGMPMELVIYAHATDSEGVQLMNFAFRPAGAVQ